MALYLAKSITAKLICFKIRSGNINILERIRTHHKQLGVLLLDDTTGTITQTIIEQYHYEASNINLDTPVMDPGKGNIHISSQLIHTTGDVSLQKGYYYNSRSRLREYK